MTDEQENVENKKDEKYKKNEKNGDKTGYYVKQPIFGTGKPSWLKQQFGKTVAIVVGALTCYSFLFSAFAGRTHIGSDSENIFGFKADCLRIGQSLIFESDSEAVDRKLFPFWKRNFLILNRRKACRDP